MLETEEIRQGLIELGFSENFLKNGKPRKYVYIFDHPKIYLPPRISRQSKNLLDNLVLPITYLNQAKTYKLNKDGFALTARRSRSSGYRDFFNDTSDQEPSALYFKVRDKKGLENFITSFFGKEILEKKTCISLNFSSIEKNEREALIKARIGQTNYRNKLIEYWGGCSLTNCKKTDLLIASHIKPWRETKDDSKHCLNLNNGLLLTPNLDKVFDKGLISFNDKGEILISPKLTDQDCSSLGISRNMKLKKILNDEQKAYLQWHREEYYSK